MFTPSGWGLSPFAYDAERREEATAAALMLVAAKEKGKR
jgi:hypothetical protein